VQFIVPGSSELLASNSEIQTEIESKRSLLQKSTEASKQAIVNKVAQAALRDRHIQLDRDPLKEWALYAAIMIAIFGFIAGRYMLTAFYTDTSHLSVAIFALFLVGLVINCKNVIRLRNEYVCAAVCIKTLQSPKGLNAVTTGPAAGIFQQHVMDLCAISHHDSSFNQDGLVSLLYNKILARSKIVEVLGSILVTLGLIGTILGLIQMTNGLSQTMASIESDSSDGSLLNGMRATMAGLGTAFNTTLIGAILGSVVLRVLNNVYTTNVDHLVNFVATTAEVSIIPKLKLQNRHRNQERQKN
jgi:hypothetical protein